MGNTSITRILRSGSIASVIFVIGAGIGWHLADFIFAPETPVPMVAAIQFEGAWPRETAGRGTTSQDHGAVQAPVPRKVESYQLAPHAASGPSEEDRYLAAALQWAEQYRKQQGMAARETAAEQNIAAETSAEERPREERQRLAAAAAFGWDEVAQNTRRFGPVRGVQDVIRAQVEREHEIREVDRSKLAGIAAGKTSPADQAAAPVAQRVEVTQGKPVLKQARAVGGRAVHRPHRRASRKVRGSEKVVCPLLWLEQAVFERRGGGSRSRSAAAG